ncbi:hypothetical protein M426DRAFT_8841 [Hypoxylon sp. CI-4A]|nr:hypothetical protein M426DRAFT_8841 [Hypoxylon sp. CI-4A]
MASLSSSSRQGIINHEKESFATEYTPKEAQSRKGKVTANIEVSPQPNESEIKHLLGAIGDLSKQREILISRLEQYIHPIPDDDTTRDSFDFKDLTANDLAEVEEKRNNFTSAIRWFPRYRPEKSLLSIILPKEEQYDDGHDEEEADSQRLDMLQVFLTAYLIDGVGYHTKQEPDEASRLINGYISQIGESYGRIGGSRKMGKVLDEWGKRNQPSKIDHQELREWWEKMTNGRRVLFPVTSRDKQVRWDLRTILYDDYGFPYQYAGDLVLDSKEVHYEFDIKDGRGKSRPNYICKLHIPQRFIKLLVLADLLCKLSGPRVPVGKEGQRYSPNLAKGAVALALSFAGGWPETHIGRSLQFLDQNYYHIQYHLRVLVVERGENLKYRGYYLSDSNPKNYPRRDSDEGGVYCQRELGTFSLPDEVRLLLDQRPQLQDDKGIGIKEARISLAGVTYIETIAPMFFIVHLSEPPFSLEDSAPVGLEQWTKANMNPGRYYKGIATFQLTLCQDLDKWVEHWSRFLFEVDRGVQLKPEDILDEEQRKKLLLETKDLKQFDLYLKLLQLFRIATQWIHQSEEDIVRLSENWTSMKNNRAELMRHKAGWDRDESVISDNWKSLIDRHNSLIEGLIPEIERKTKAITNLQDALSNATSVGEAIKSGELGRYIYIFTIATIVYLPISFVVTFFSMDLVKGEFPWETTKAFIISFVTIPICTYVVLFGFWANDKRRHEGFGERWQSKWQNSKASWKKSMQDLVWQMRDGEIWNGLGKRMMNLP